MVRDSTTIDTRLIERHAARAWPAEEAREEDGWLLRHTPGVPRRRSNSALPVGLGNSLLDGLERVEQYYAGHGLPVAVQVAPAEEHTALDAALDARGYRRDSATLVCTAPTAAVADAARPATPLDVTLAEHPTRAWLDAYAELEPGGTEREAAEQLFHRIGGPAAHLGVERDGRLVGIGLVVAAPGCAGVFCMATDPAHRRRGIAGAILHVGARWAQARGAGTLYLQVTAGNTTARRLYERVGFEVSHSYHYRLKP
ncbi:GNAT family N-acetyltransferase [Kitasatospora purpeofusca]|uniref:GNAT family N-acetyltransferase n=1 Tax=Kitasatospora purpeofusca TaxID=67352 RepID=UPI003866D8EF|nr:GNAT family N-acetyltransferase [Kitasatospora purpeofusca]